MLGVVALGAPLVSTPTYSKLAIFASLFVKLSVTPSFPLPETTTALGVPPVGE